MNLNEKIRIRVHPSGMEIIRRERERLTREIPSIDWSSHEEPAPGGTLEGPAWLLMQLFGPHIHNGSSPIDTEIDLIDKGEERADMSDMIF